MLRYTKYTNTPLVVTNVHKRWGNEKGNCTKENRFGKWFSVELQMEKFISDVMIMALFYAWLSFSVAVFARQNRIECGSRFTLNCKKCTHFHSGEFISFHCFIYFLSQTSYLKHLKRVFSLVIQFSVRNELQHVDRTRCLCL